MTTTRKPLPTLWLLGKTGAGKSSLIRYLTGNSGVIIGNGFRPCTTTAQSYDFPDEQPWIRFLDTRGLGEAEYDPEEDLVLCRSQSHALLICVRLDDPEQSSLLNAVRSIKKKGSIKAVLVIHTASDQITDSSECERIHCHQQTLIEGAWGASLPNICMDLGNTQDPIGGELLQQHLIELLPVAAQLSEKLKFREEERVHFVHQQTLIRRYATAAAATDTLPGVGMITVPSIQAALLRHLAKSYQREWSRKDLSAFIGTLGAGFGIQYASHLGLRQLVKLIPVYGQTLGSAGAAAVSFTTTYAMGRVACLYLFYQKYNVPISSEELQRHYRKAFTSIRQESSDEKTD